VKSPTTNFERKRRFLILQTSRRRPVAYRIGVGITVVSVNRARMSYRTENTVSIGLWSDAIRPRLSRVSRIDADFSTSRVAPFDANT
jgi:hypothetical protein